MLKSYNFWIRLVAVLVLLLRVVGAEFGFSVDSGLIIDLATAIASVLVVLGVIQVPVDNSITNANIEIDKKGEFMKNFEQIKADIISAKEKLISGLGENEVVGEIVGILDGIIDEKTEETTVKPEEVNVCQTIEIETGAIKEEKVEEVNVEEVKPEEVLPAEDIAEVVNDVAGEVADTTEIKSGEEVVSPATNDNIISSETESKLNEILKAKLKEIIERDMDEILAQL